MFKLNCIGRTMGRTTAPMQNQGGIQRLGTARMRQQSFGAIMLMSSWACGGSPAPSPTAPSVIQGLRISAPAFVEAGTTAQVSAATVLNDGTNQPVEPLFVRWLTSDTTVGNISTTGVLSALESGVMVVQGSYQQWTSGPIEVTVTPLGSLIPRITVGQNVEGVLCCENGSHTAYTLTATSDGTLIVHLSWSTNQLSLEMYVDDAHFNNPGNSPPLIGKVRVVAGRTYRIRVVDGAPWDYHGLNLPFVLATSME